jgi:hypothetical protein
MTPLQSLIELVAIDRDDSVPVFIGKQNISFPNYFDKASLTQLVAQ